MISRVLPELYREAGLHRMEPYFSALRSALLQSAQGDLADPRVVVLSPGTHSETAYDQAFVASALGFPLVQGSDLVVRDGWVWMRAPGRGAGGRLERVDVILRRVDASFSDPARAARRLPAGGGRAGRGGAARPGPHRQRARRRGAGEPRPAALPARRLRGAARRAAAARLGPHLVVRRPRLPGPRALAHRPARGAHPRRAARPGSLGTPRARAADPRRAVPLGRAGAAAALAGTDLGCRRPDQRRGHAGAGDAGGPSRCATGRRTARWSAAWPASWIASGSGERSRASKDVWVIKASPGDADQGLAEVLPMTSARSVSVLVPRILEDLFWVGRYAERAEGMLRMVLTAHGYAEDYRTRPRSSGGASLEVFLDVIHRLAGRVGADLDEEFRSLLLDAERVGSAAHALGRLRDALLGVRDQLSGDTWRGVRHHRPGDGGPRGVAAQPPGRRVGRPDAHRRARAAGRQREHDARRRLAHDRRRAAPRARRSSCATCWPPPRPCGAASTWTARCSTACWPCPRARSPTAAATAATSGPTASSSCCWSTPTTRAR